MSTTTLSRKDMAAAIAGKVGSDMETVTDSLEAIERVVIDALGTGKKVKLNGFGTFSLRHREVKSAGAVNSADAIRTESIIGFKPAKALVAIDEQ